MADTTLRAESIPGSVYGTLTLKLYDSGSTTVLNSPGDDAAGTAVGYDWTVSEAITGECLAVAYDSDGVEVARGYTPEGLADDTGTYVIRDRVGVSRDAIKPLASAPAAAAPIEDQIAWLYLLSRNKQTQTESTATVYADDTSTAVATASASDDGTTFTRGEWN